MLEHDLNKHLRAYVGDPDNQVYRAELVNILCSDNRPNSPHLDRFLFVYGSLRQDQYNYERMIAQFGKENFVFIHSGYANSFRLYSMGAYPVAVEDDYRYQIQGEIFYCSPEVANAIKNMELGAGYKASNGLVWLKTSPKVERSMFCRKYVATEMLKDIVKKNTYMYPEVKSGNWVKYIMQTNAILETNE